MFVQNLKPGALAKLGFAFERLRKDYPRLICCSISGYGESGPYAQRKAYDLLIQAESGLSSVTGGPEAPARVGVSIVDIAAGLNAYEAILEALIARGKSGEGAEISRLHVRRHGGMDDGAAAARRRRQRRSSASGSRMPTIAPYGVFKTPRRRRYPDRDPERPRMARAGRQGPGRCRARQPIRTFATNPQRVRNRARDRRAASRRCSRATMSRR